MGRERGGRRATSVSLCVAMLLLASCSLDRTPRSAERLGSSIPEPDGGSALFDGGVDGGADAANGGSGSGGSGSGGSAGTSVGGAGGESGSGGAGTDAGVDAGNPDASTISLPPAGLATCSGFGWDGDTTCPAACTGGCDQGRCTIDCTSFAACTSATLECPAGLACRLDCNGPQACTQARVVCADGPCDVECSGASACSQMRVDCGDEACRVTCTGATTGTALDLRAGASCGATKPQCLL